jgi:hypothetical protein
MVKEKIYASQQNPYSFRRRWPGGKWNPLPGFSEFAMMSPIRRSSEKKADFSAG